MIIKIDRRHHQACVGNRGNDQAVRLNEANHDGGAESLCARQPDRLAGCLTESKIGKPEHRIVIEEALPHRLTLKQMVAETAALFIEGMLPEELAGAACGRNPLRLVKDFSRMCQSRNREPIEGNYNLFIAGWLAPLLADFEQLGAQRGEPGRSVMKDCPAFVRNYLVPADPQYAQTTRLIRPWRQFIEPEKSIRVSRP